MVTLVEVDPEQVVSRIQRDSLEDFGYTKAANAVPIRAGRSELSVTVQVVWELA